MHRMTADISELLRLILNLIRLGTIAEIDHDTQRVRVQVGNNLTNWRPWATTRAGGAQTWWPPTIGEQVVLLSPEGNFDHAVIFPAVYSDQFAPPSTNPDHHTTRYGDGTIVQYDSAVHTLSATLPDGTSVTVEPGKVTSNADDTICTGNLTVLKNLIVAGLSSLNGGMAVTPGAGGGAAAVINGTLTATDDVVAGGVSLMKHPHGGVERGGDLSDGPQ
ncbi:phage baseplate assembly protein V [Glaciimonas sp. PAMC28666]|uniref:phage baseplate assembly protein V n=1 Tax=Glaciimonas sp. PAMC28666 TaxID=2807626 RepID=UPI0019632C65|nr:phage baseplate assembly protein V [Glaciimonas sp. PAMC28666]QRX80876.1 phage baseplate assembly protein V [Glaciimonas sp. PAMC28666]QRX82306.1 phage baseplate assembly protein V [Glaciimonas sp. PAMC28666]